MAQRQAQWIWMNGEIVPREQACVQVSAHALHYGNGVFEGIRCYDSPDGPALFRVDDHIDRLFASATVYEMKIPYSSDALVEAICQVVHRNRLRECYIRPLCFFAGHLAMHPVNDPIEVAIIALPFFEWTGKESKKKGIRVTISSWRKFSSSMVPTTAKGCGQYLNSLLAVQEATRRGYDEALLLNSDNQIAEGPAENVFLVKDGTLLTNDERSSILPGITRATVVKIARDLGLPVEICALDLEKLYSADEAFLTGTAVEIVPVHEVDGRKIGSGVPGRITELIQESFQAAVTGHDGRYRGWLHPVPMGTGQAVTVSGD